jgi:hypothetical protein
MNRHIVAEFYLLLGFFVSFSLILFFSNCNGRELDNDDNSKTYNLFINPVTKTKIAYQLATEEKCNGFIPIDDTVIRCRNGEIESTVPYQVAFFKITEYAAAQPTEINLESPVRIANPYGKIYRYGRGFMNVGGINDDL